MSDMRESSESYEQDFYGGSGYSQAPLDTQAAGFKKVHARGNYSTTPSSRARNRASAEEAGGENPVKGALAGVGSAVGKAFGGAKDAVAGAISGIASKAGIERTADESAQPSDGDYVGVGDPCRVCGNPVAPTQERCPHCGAFRKPIWQYPAFIVATAATLVLIVLFSIMLNSCSGDAGAPTPANVPGQTGTEATQGADGTEPADGTVIASDEKIALAAAIASAQSTYDTEVNSRTYTIYSVARLGRAIDAANAVYVDSAASSDQIATATTTLSNAVTGLTIMPGGEGYSTPSYAELSGNPDVYFETLVVLSGTVQTTSNDGATTTTTVALNGEPQSMVSLSYRSSELFSDAPAAGNEILFYGTVSGTAPYTNGLGETVQIPAIVGDYVVML